MFSSDGLLMIFWAKINKVPTFLIYPCKICVMNMTSLAYYILSHRQFATQTTVHGIDRLEYSVVPVLAF